MDKTENPSISKLLNLKGCIHFQENTWQDEIGPLRIYPTYAAVTRWKRISKLAISSSQTKQEMEGHRWKTKLATARSVEDTTLLGCRITAEMIVQKTCLDFGRMQNIIREKLHLPASLGVPVVLSPSFAGDGFQLLAHQWGSAKSVKVHFAPCTARLWWMFGHKKHKVSIFVLHSVYHIIWSIRDLSVPFLAKLINI